MGEPQRPPAGMDPPKLLLPTVNTLVLPASSVAVYWADSGVKEGNQRALRVWMLAAVGLSVLFLLLKVVEYGNVEYGPADHAYGSIVWTIVGFHSAHVLSVTLKAIVVDLLAWWGFFNQQRRIGVQVNGILALCRRRVDSVVCRVVFRAAGTVRHSELDVCRRGTRGKRTSREERAGVWNILTLTATSAAVAGCGNSGSGCSPRRALRLSDTRPRSWPALAPA
jgi:hypothetical protein